MTNRVLQRRLHHLTAYPMSADFWASYISGAAGIVIGNPLDILKVQAQASRISSTSTELPTQPVNRVLRSFTSARALLTGLPAPVVTYGALNALLFTSYHQALLFSCYLEYLVGRISAFPPNVHTQYSYWSHFTSGCLAGFATFIVSAPTELIKCRAQTSRSQGPTSKLVSSWSIARSVYVLQGIGGLYRGGVVTSIRDAVGYGCYFVTYEASKDLWRRLARSRSSQTDPRERYALGKLLSNDAAKTLLCGGLAGVASWTSIFPLDVIKTRVQAQFETPADLSSQYKGKSEKLDMRRNGAWAVAKQAYLTEGMGVFSRGLGVCCVRAFIVNAVQWSIYESIMKHFNDPEDIHARWV